MLSDSVVPSAEAVVDGARGVMSLRDSGALLHASVHEGGAPPWERLPEHNTRVLRPGGSVASTSSDLGTCTDLTVACLGQATEEWIRERRELRQQALLRVQALIDPRRGSRSKRGSLPRPGLMPPSTCAGDKLPNTEPSVAMSPSAGRRCSSAAAPPLSTTACGQPTHSHTPPPGRHCSAAAVATGAATARLTRRPSTAVSGAITPRAPPGPRPSGAATSPRVPIRRASTAAASK